MNVQNEHEEANMRYLGGKDTMAVFQTKGNF